ncbi:TPA: hypothetical protein P0E06_004004 [Vibrio fluvialis clinical-1]|nr:hypothetical protein [Vibrio fluvialis clinical-1]
MAPNKTTTVDQLLIVLELYHRIPIGRKITASELHQQLRDVGIHRDIRTVQRNLELVVKFFDVDKDDRDKPYGYRRRLGSRVPPSPRASILLETAFAHLKAVLPETYHAAIDDTQPHWLPPFNPRPKVDIRYPRPRAFPSGYDATVFEKVCLALYYQRAIRLVLNDNTDLPVVHPLGLILEDDELLLVYQYQGTRCTVSLPEIDAIHVSTYTFDYPDNFSLTEVVTAPAQKSS